MNPRNHQIGKLVLKLEFDSEQAANELQKSFTGTFETQVKSVLDEVFSSLSNNGETIVIDHLKLNLGQIKFDDFAASLKNEVINSVQKILIAEAKEEIPAEVLKIPDSKTSFEILIFFIQNGHFPWWAGESTIHQLETAFISTTAFSDVAVQNKFYQVLSSPNCQKRLAVQFSEDFNRILISKFNPENAEIIFKTIELFKNILTKIQLSIEEIAREWPVLVWPILLLPQEKANFRKQIPSKVILAFCEKYQLNVAEVSTQLQNHKDFENLVFIEKNQESEPIVPDKLKDLTKKTRKEQVKKEPSTTEIIIANAGLVIFYPFLQQLFKHLNLMEGTAFLIENHHEKAVLITQFLVTGQFETEEFELPLNKLIAGWPIEKPLAKAIILAENEQAIVEDFLCQIIKNWPALKNTSIAGLRETFLQRNGILRSAPEKWTLKIERKTVDILRDSLPWPISIVKLPWMDKILYVEW